MFPTMYEEEMFEASIETMKTCIFKSNKWFVSAENEKCKDRWAYKSVISEEEITLKECAS